MKFPIPQASPSLEFRLPRLGIVGSTGRPLGARGEDVEWEELNSVLIPQQQQLTVAFVTKPDASEDQRIVSMCCKVPGWSVEQCLASSGMLRHYSLRGLVGEAYNLVASYIPQIHLHSAGRSDWKLKPAGRRRTRSAHVKRDPEVHCDIKINRLPFSFTPATSSLIHTNTTQAHSSTTTMAGIGRFIYSQLFVTPPKPTGDLTGQTVIVTGSNVGLGKEAARHFTQLNASRVILAVRSTNKGEAARKDIESTTGRNDVVRVMQLDMSSYQSVLDFAERVSKELDRVNIAVLNAGVNRGVWEVFEQDESTITVNVVSTFLLAFALLPKLKETANKFNTRPTLTIVSSEVHEWTPFVEKNAPEGKIFERLNEKIVDGKEVGLGNRYHVSKLLEILFVRAFCQRYPESQIPVTVNLVNPGFCHS